ncbi:MAG: protein-L-isoaspartate(D-aspartate) O-methyltransferase [Patescibacteria group bacterium]
MGKVSELVRLRRLMVQEQLKARDITDSRVLKAMAKIPREKFVPRNLRNYAYNDAPLSIGFGQTISQPYIVAKMCQSLELRGDEKVLDVGTGSGYQAAVLAALAGKVISIDRIPELAEMAKKTISKLGYDNIKIIIGDGSKGVLKEAPFDVIVSAAASKSVPQAWKDQLIQKGKIIMPLKKLWGQELIRLVKSEKGFNQKSFGSVVFISLVVG